MIAAGLFCFQNISYSQNGTDNKDIEKAGYQTIKNTLFYNGVEIEGADVNTLKILTNNYAKDSLKVYYKQTKIEDAHTNTFEVLSYGYAKDTLSSYYRGEKIVGIKVEFLKKTKDCSHEQ